MFKESFSKSILHSAAYNGRIDEVKKLIELINEDVNGKDPACGYTPLHVAVLGRHEKIVEFLMKAGAKDDIVGGFCSDTPLNTAVNMNSIPMISCLLNAGADVNSTSSEGESPLLLAVGKGRIDMILSLLEAGANVNKASLKSNTPLLGAVRINKVDIVQLLLKAGADINKANSKGITPLQMAIEYKHQLNINALLKVGAGLWANLSKLELNIDDLTDAVVIGLLVDNQPVSRKMKGFENAITNLEELREAINKGISFDRKRTQDACDQILAKDPNNTLAKQVKWELHYRNKSLLHLCLNWFNNAEHSSHRSELNKIPVEIKERIDSHQNWN